VGTAPTARRREKRGGLAGVAKMVEDNRIGEANRMEKGGGKESLNAEVALEKKLRKAFG